MGQLPSLLPVGSWKHRAREPKWSSLCWWDRVENLWGLGWLEFTRQRNGECMWSTENRKWGHWESVLHNLLIPLKSLAECLSAQVCEESTRGKERATEREQVQQSLDTQTGYQLWEVSASGGVLRGSCLGLGEISPTPEAALVSPKSLRYAFKSKRTTNLFCKKSDSKYLELGRPSGLSVTTTPS